MSATENTEARLRKALQAYVLSVQHAQECVNPENWETEIDWARLRRGADAALEDAVERQWVMRAVVICNAHLPEEEFNRLRNAWPEEFCYVQNFNDGMIVYTGEDVDSIDDEYPEDLKNCIRWAIEQGFTHVRFDPDGEVIPELTDYGW